jgi:hypothetical protein
MTIVEAVAYLESPEKILSDIFAKELQTEINRAVVRSITKKALKVPTRHVE